jgi:hypothetical protein
VIYPHKHEANEVDVDLSLAGVEKIRNIKPLIDIRKTANDENNK